MDVLAFVERRANEISSKKKKLYCLDRNIISAIKDLNAGKPVRNNDVLCILKQIDCKNSIIIPFFLYLRGSMVVSRR